MDNTTTIRSNSEKEVYNGGAPNRDAPQIPKLRLQLYLPQTSEAEDNLETCVTNGLDYKVLQFVCPSMTIRTNLRNYLCLDLAVPKYAVVTLLKNAEPEIVARRKPGKFSYRFRRLMYENPEALGNTALTFYCSTSDDLDILAYLLRTCSQLRNTRVTLERLDRESGKWMNREIGAFYRKSVVDQLRAMSSAEVDTLMRFGQEYGGYLERIIERGRATVLNILGMGF